MISIHYHDRTKHHFNRFSRSLGYLDWATQPDPFRTYQGAPLIELPRAALAVGVPYGALYDGSAAPFPITLASIGEFLRCSMGLSAWKQYGASRWALRVNPSSGNLHPTETYVIWEGRVCHYAPRDHLLEERCVIEGAAWDRFIPQRETGSAFLVGLSSIHWREAWKYGERAFRYCQHDAGHAIGALRLSAALLGWRLALLSCWPDVQVAALLGLDRDADYAGAEREEPECLAIVTPAEPATWSSRDHADLAGAARAASWAGVANRLSVDRVDWPIIEEVSHRTRFLDGATVGGCDAGRVRGCDGATERETRAVALRTLAARTLAPSHRPTVAALSARSVILQRRSAVAFDGKSELAREVFIAMLRRLCPPEPPWDAIDWAPQVHLALFVHRVQGLVPGLYAYLRDGSVRREWQTAMRPEFLWEPVNDPNDPSGLFLLVPIDCRRTAKRLSCDQDIAEDGFFSLAMLARFEETLRERGEWFYRRLFWECGLIGQVLYLEAEAAGARATGIGCFYDDPVHEVLGLTGHLWQSLYHFSMGMPVEDTRLTTEPGYAWEGVG